MSDTTASDLHARCEDSPNGTVALPQPPSGESSVTTVTPNHVSELPWRIGSPEGHVWSGRRLVANCMGHQDNFTVGLLDTNIGNAAYIVHACNLYPELLAALKELERDCVNTLVRLGEPGTPGTVRRAQAAIARAEATR